MENANVPEVALSCPYTTCLYYGERDESGSYCNDLQIAVCKETRARAEINCKFITGDARCAKGSEPGYVDWCVLGPCSDYEKEADDGSD